MGTFSGHSNNPYATGISNRFTIPGESGGKTAISVTATHASFIVSLYTLMIALIFQLAWNLVVTATVVFSPHHKRTKRYLPLVFLWNSSGPASTASMIREHYTRIITDRIERNKNQPNGNPEQRLEEGSKSNQDVGSGMNQDPPTKNPDISTHTMGTNTVQPPAGSSAGSPATDRQNKFEGLWWGVLFMTLAYIMWIGGIAGCIFTTSKLQVGYFALAAPSSIAYPDVDKLIERSGVDSALETLFSLRAPSALSAIKAVDAAYFTAANRVHVKRLDSPAQRTDNPWAGLDYSYNITGVDMGLQSDPKLTLRVSGSCHTDYTWLVNSTDEEDTYGLWGGKDTFKVSRKGEPNIPPRVTFLIDHEQLDKRPSNMSYAMIINTASYYSYTFGQDPWYATEKSRTNESSLYRVLPGRPVVSCWEAKRWHLKGKDVEHAQLKKLPGLKLHKFWIEKVFPNEFWLPRVVSLGSVAGVYTLKSQLIGVTLYGVRPIYALKAGSCSLVNDIQRWVLASWVSDRDVLRDTTTYHLDGMENSAVGPGGTVDASLAGFIIESVKVGALSVRVLITIPSLLIILLLVHVPSRIWMGYKDKVKLPSIHHLVDEYGKLTSHILGGH
ncbi:hypothetical protein HOY82DRAFT_601190 [Tuber indicum]|nr:hypothetical protein HOY82DRAFT_601190 [Tuber indicum]